MADGVVAVPPPRHAMPWCRPYGTHRRARRTSDGCGNHEHEAVSAAKSQTSAFAGCRATISRVRRDLLRCPVLVGSSSPNLSLISLISTYLTHLLIYVIGDQGVIEARPGNGRPSSRHGIEGRQSFEPPSLALSTQPSSFPGPAAPSACPSFLDVRQAPGTKNQSERNGTESPQWALNGDGPPLPRLLPSQVR